jgi:hypothetical protein
MKRLKSLLFFCSGFLIALFACSETGIPTEQVILETAQEAKLTDGSRHVFKDAQGAPYLRLSFDNKPSCSAYGPSRLTMTENEMELFAHNILLDIDEYKSDFPDFEYVVLQFFDFETGAVIYSLTKP